MRLIRVMCSGRVDLSFVLRAFSNGVDGVFIGACRLNECNYITHGNYHALNMVHLAKRIMAHLGINPERLRIEFMSAGDGILFAESVNDFIGKVKEIGPFAEAEGVEKDELRSRIQEASRLVPYVKLVNREKMDLRLEAIEAYNDLYGQEEIAGLLDNAISYYIDPARCQACMICLKKCPVEAIIGGKNRIHVIDQERCIKCGTCLEACPPRFGAAGKVFGGPVPPPLPEDQRAVVRRGKE